MFIWNLYENDYHDYNDAKGDSLEFYLGDQLDSVFGNYRVKECGLRQLSLQDAEDKCFQA